MNRQPRRKQVISLVLSFWFATLACYGDEKSNQKDKVEFSKEQIQFFQKEIEPLLKENCQKCHGLKGSSKGGLTLTSRTGLLRGGDTGPAFNEKKPLESSLLSAINYESFEMPPSGKLPAEKIALLTRWIKMGAPWTPGVKDVPGHEKKSDVVTDQDRSWWAYQPIVRRQPPKVNEKGWGRNAVDSFILSRLEQEGLKHAPEATRRTLVRRLYYDITGLPPTPTQVTAFVKDSSPLAYERLVDQLLSSAQFGEKWGRHWLDLVRFAETNGYERDSPKPFAWRYRDYVIGSLNKDKPYDRFLLEQLAGDEIPNASIEELTATGYYRLAIWDDEPADGKLAKYDYLDSILSTTSQVTMGMTLGCARCHSHKADPIPHSDYYSMLAIFENVAWSMRDQPTRTISTPEAKRRFEMQKLAHAKSMKSATEAIGKFRKELVAAMKAAGLPMPVDSRELKPLVEDSRRKGQAWWYTFKKPADDWAAPGFVAKDAGWKEGPGGFGTQGTPGSRVRTTWNSEGIWLRKKFPLKELPKSLTLRFHHDEDIAIYLNGVLIHSEGGYLKDYRQIALPPKAMEALQTGQNVLAVHCKQTGGGQYVDAGLYEASGAPTFAEAIALHGEKLLGKERLTGFLQNRKRLDQLKRSAPDPRKAGGTTILCVAERGNSPTFVWLRGNPHLKGPQVNPSSPQVLPVSLNIPSARTPMNTSGRRTALAQWLAQPDHPLTSRVMVNRIWQHYFGRGIVPTPNDFGKLGQRPSHPELLDWLASELIRHNWSLKELHRTILLSSTYRMSSQDVPGSLAKDPANRMWWRHGMRRLSAEEIRDSILSVNGSLNLEMQGPSIYTKVPAAILQTASRPNAAWGRSNPSDQSRRSVYVYVKRSLVEPFLGMFDFADTDNSCAVRFATTVPTQSLSMLNSEFINEQAGVFANRLRRDCGTNTRAQVRRALELALSRPISDQEVQNNVALIEELQKEDGISSDQALNYFCLMVLNLNEFVYLD